ncbi:MAG: hypothetical protein HGA69_00015 [Desulfobulbaceae bacterium]|nr:hypothetical protein [Desulfobulbaceae bacterium]
MSRLVKAIRKINLLLPVIIGMLLLSFPASMSWAEKSGKVMKDFESLPVSIVQSSSTPQVQINASNDHQLFFKAYNDYTDLDDDEVAETTYKHSINYYGYFDSYKCYSYVDASKRFEPVSVTPDKYCSGQWSGNFLNWASMTRIDAVRKILFGGHRRVDTTNETVLERAFLPPDIHAFAKHYNGVDLSKLTPYTANLATSNSTSTTEYQIGAGSKIFAVPTPGSWANVGDYVKIAAAAPDSGNFMEGWITATDTVANNITVNVTSATGSGTFNSWNITNSSTSPPKMASATPHTIDTSSKDFFFATDPSGNFRVGEYVAVTDKADPSHIFSRGWVTTVDASKIIVDVIGTGDVTAHSDWTINNTRTGAPIANSTSLTIGTGSKRFSFTTNPSLQFKMGDALVVTSDSLPGQLSMTGKVSEVNDAEKYIIVGVTATQDNVFHNDWYVANLSRTGITLCNVTYSTNNDFSETLTDPPLIRVAEGNFSFWANGEVNQCLWTTDPGVNGQNYNNPELSGIPALRSPPVQVSTNGKDYVARVVACKDLNGDGVYDDLDGTEHCKKYSVGSAKPIGLLQDYGDSDELLFGMIAGTYGKSKKGGDMVMPLFFQSNGAHNMCREINLGRDCDGNGSIDDLTATGHVPGDGTFKKVYSWVGGPASAQDAEGVINTWSIYRIKGYKYGDWNYNNNSGDKCPLSVNFFGGTSSSECQNWGNPFSEIYLTSLRHWAGLNAPTDYQASDTAANSVFAGLHYLNGVWADPLTESNYCAPLSLINFNSSISSVDTAFGQNNQDDADELDSTNQGIEKDLKSPFSSTTLTNQIGVAEGINAAGKKWFIGEVKGGIQDRFCTAKTVSELGNARGLCPEGPGLRGGYRIAGMAWYAHTNDIRPSTLTGNRALKGTQTVDNYSVRFSSGNPLVKIPVPGANSSVTIIPSCIDNSKNNYGCTLTDFKILKAHTLNTAGTVGTGKFFASWEDSLQGNDFDLDAGGIYEYEITNSQIKVTTAVTMENLGYSIGHGYVINGTKQDGMHIHSGTNNFQYPPGTTTGIDSNGIQGCLNCNGPQDGGGDSSTVVYTIGTSEGSELPDPLWYVAKWGGFEDKNGDKKPGPDSTEWDSKNNKTGVKVPDGIPDNYFYASHPKELEDSLRSAFDAILERTSSGTAAAVVASNVRGEGALFQAFYEPLLKQAGKEATWIGTLQALWLDSYGLTRQDCTPPGAYTPGDSCPTSTDTCGTPNGILDDYCVDKVVDTYLDIFEERTRARIYKSNATTSFDPFSLQGVVQTYTSGTGAVVMVPNSLEGYASYNTGTHSMTLTPYTITGTVTVSDSGVVTMDVTPAGWHVPFGSSAQSWDVENLNTAGLGKSGTALTFPGSLPSTTISVTATVTPADLPIALGETLTFITKKPVGRLGDQFTAWDVTCLNGASAKGNFKDVDNPITIENTQPNTFVIDNITGDFAGCTSALISTYNMQGTSGASYSSWRVSDLETNFEGGLSTSSMMLSNSGSRSFDVTPTNSWLTAGDRVLVANNSYTTVELNQINYLWNAREQLYLTNLSDTTLSTNRSYNAQFQLGGRYIKTWIDTDRNGIVDTGEYRDFDTNMFTTGSPPVPYGFFDVTTQAEAENIVKYTRGIEVAGTRNRTVMYSAIDSQENVMRLGDIINSTPTVVGAPQEAFNILYKDKSYDEFRKKYQDRRVMIYAGGNDGLFHAFNAGFYRSVSTGAPDNYYIKTVEYSKAGYNYAPSVPTAATQHNLGAEMWAYAPYNLISHLQWLKDPDYAKSHVYFMDAKPRIFDAKIFASDQTHPNGWGTVLVAGMNLGGGSMTVDTASNGLATTSDNVTLHSAYIIFDITNPEEPPTLLGEIPLPDNSFTTVIPAVLAFKDTDKNQSGVSCTDASANCVNKWYLQFGTGPNNIGTYTSNQTTKMYLFDLEQLTTGPQSVPTVGNTVFVTNAANPTTCVVTALTTKTNVINCDTAVANSFMGTPVVVEWDLNFYADTSYFGLVGDATADTGQVMRIDFNNSEVPGDWEEPKTFFQSDRPIVGQPVPAIDNLNPPRKWVFFGSGRYYANLDKTSFTTQSLYGVLDDETGNVLSPTSLLDVSNVEVYTDRTLNTPLATLAGDPFYSATSLSTFDELQDYMDGKDDVSKYGPMGWKLDMPPIVGISGSAPATRNTTRSALLGGVLFSTAFQPSEDACIGEGQSRLYGLFYKTGTAYPGPTIFGTAVETVGTDLKYRATKYINLGVGVATAPAIHSGSGSGGDEVNVFAQQSTGNIVRVPAQMIESVRTGKTSWSDR